MVYYETDTDDDFERLKSYGRPMIIKFYSPTCHHCKTIAPFFASYAKLNGVKLDEPKNGNNKILFLIVDGTKCKKLCSQIGKGIRGFPTIRAYKVGQSNHSAEQVGSIDTKNLFYEKIDHLSHSIL
jgi:thiol-disulfide isomerase/thioredoxin